LSDIDAQHKKLVVMINELYKAMRTGQGHAVLSSLLESLLRYTQEHFTYEEGVMKRSGYSVLPAHIEEHRALTRKVQEFRTQFLNGKVTMTMSVMTFLKDWLQNHILGSDAAYARTVTAKSTVRPTGVNSR
jgi:hemerythrin